MTLKKTALYEQHLKLNAKMTDFAGYDMPLQYKGVLEEHRAVRHLVGLFDISHMGQIFIKGENAKALVHKLTTNNINNITDWRCQYSVCCYEDGGIVDDVISYQFSPEKYLIVVNAANIQKDFEWFKKNNNFDSVTVEDRSDDFFQLALQGPLAKNVLTPLVDFPLYRLATFQFCDTELRGRKIILSRTGYTGEDGFEIYGKNEDANFVWETILKSGRSYNIQPIGLAARDSLRMEAAYSLYGHEIDKDINPFESRLSWVVKLDQHDFIGKQALIDHKNKAIQRRLIGLEMIENGIPRQNFSVFDGDKKIGFVTSGGFSPSLEKAIAIALVDEDHVKEDGDYFIEIRDKQRKAKAVELPFYKKKPCF